MSQKTVDEWKAICSPDKTPELYKKQEEFYKSLNTWDAICYYGYLYVIDLVCYFPYWALMNRKNCYEYGDNIQFYLQEFNLYGFRTHCSQPSRIVTENNIYNQKAFVNGYMKKELAKKIFDELSSDNRINIHSYPASNNSNIFENDNLNINDYSRFEIDDTILSIDEYMWKRVLNALKIHSTKIKY